MGRGSSKIGGGGSNILATESAKFEGVTSELRRNFMIEHSDLYRGDTAVNLSAWNAIDVPNGFDLASVDTILYNKGNPDKNGFIDAEVKFTLRKKTPMGSSTLGGGSTTGKTKSDNWQTVHIKVFE